MDGIALIGGATDDRVRPIKVVIDDDTNPEPSSKVPPVAADRNRLKVSLPSNKISCVVWTETVLEVSPAAKVNFEQGEIEGRQDRVAIPH